MPVVEWFAAQLMRWRHGSRSISISRHTSRWHPTDAGVGGWWSLTDEVRDRKCSAAVINVGSRRHYSFGGGSDRATALMRRFMAGRWDAARPPVSGCRPTRDKQDSDSNYFLQVEPSSLSVSNFFVVDNMSPRLELLQENWALPSLTFFTRSDVNAIDNSFRSLTHWLLSVGQLVKLLMNCNWNSFCNLLATDLDAPLDVW